MNQAGKRPIRSRVVAISAAIVVAGALAPGSASAAITSVFTEAIPGSGGPATPVACEVLDGTGTGQVAGDAGVRFCGSRDTDSNDPGNEPDRTTVATFDGVPIDVNVAFPPEPESGPDGSFPMVMMFHGYAGSKIGLSGMRRWLSQGYATFSMSTRGFGESCGSAASRTANPTGCEDGYVRLLDTRYEVRDAQELAGQLVDEGLVDPGAIGATGGSYGGGLSMALAALRDRKMLPDGSLTAWESPDETPLSIAAAAPEIPWTDLAYSLVPNGGLLDYVDDAPYFGAVQRIGVEKQTWVQTLYFGGQASGFYAPEGADPDADLTGWKNLLDTGGPYDGDPVVDDIVDEITTHHSSYYIDDSIEPAPLLISSGWTDDLFPANEAIRFYNRTRATWPDAPIGLTFADFGHPRGQGQAADLNVIGARENAWMAHYLKGEGPAPAQGVDALTQACGEASAGPFHADEYSELAPGEIRFESAAAKTIATDGVAHGNAYGSILARSCDKTPATDSPGGAIYKLPAAPASGYTLAGSPTVVADIQMPGRNSQVAARLMDIAPASEGGEQRLIARALWRPKVSPRKPVRQVFQLNPNAWEFEEGHVAKLELLPHDSTYGRVGPGQAEVEVSDLELRLPVLETPGALGGLVEEPAEKVLPGTLQLAPGFDSGPPATRSLSGPGVATSDTTPTFDFMSSDPGSTYECRLDSSDDLDWADCPRGITVGPLSEGQHVFEVRAKDVDDNLDPTPLRYEFAVDTVNPNTSASLRVRPGSVVVSFDSNEALASFQCKRGKPEWRRCESPKKLDRPVGKRRLRIRAVDAAGNVDPTPALVKLPRG
jgi:hypothetical protein